MTISEAIMRRPVRIARSLIATYKDEAERIVYGANNINFREKQVLLQCLKIVRVRLFNLRGYE